MNNRWTEDLRSRMSDYEVDAPEHLFDDIMDAVEAAEKFVSTAEMPIETVAEPERRGALLPLWGRRVAVAASVAAIVAVGVLTLNIEREVEQMEQIIAMEQPTPAELPVELQEVAVAETVPQEVAVVEAEPQRVLLKKSAPVQSNMQPSPEQTISEPSVEQVELQKSEAEARQETPNNSPSQRTQQNQPQRSVYAARPPQRVASQRSESRLAANVFASGFSGASNGFASQQLFSLSSALYGSRVEGGAGDGDEMLQPDASRTISRDVHHHQPIRLGITLRYAFAPRWAVESGLNYSHLRSDVTVGNPNNYYDERTSLHYIGLPVNVVYSLLSTRAVELYVMAGGMVEKCVSGSLRTNYFVGGEPHNNSHSSVSVDGLQFSANASAGVQLNLSPTVGLYAEPGVGYWFDNGSKVESIYHDRPLNFNLNLGLRFTFK
ncbi:MAG: outer membrane beta-barrel protein [Alistipes sp.]|nr:outer membrane beta-barrel protein [Alistipes sp.]